MLGEVKKKLLEEPEYLQQVLEDFGFGHVKIHRTYVSFGHDESTSAKSVVIKLENNNYCYVNDYSWNINKEIFSYIMEVKNVTFSEVLGVIRSIFGEIDFDNYQRTRRAFGGWYDSIKEKSSIEQVKTIDMSELDQFENICNMRFLKDNISLEAQRHFKIMFDEESNGIVIPIFSGTGQLMGAKERCNYDSDSPDFQKYWYKIPCLESNTLYGYFENYKHLTDGKIYLLESEKSVMQAYSYGHHEEVALGSGSLSDRQIEMILELNPKEVVFLHDQGFDHSSMMRNIDRLRNFTRFLDLKIGYWDWTNKDYPAKVSPTDMGKAVYEYILANEIKYIEEVDDEI